MPPLGEVVDHTTTIEQSVKLLRSRDALHAYVYVPALEGHFDESVACLFRPTSVSDEFLREPPRRVAQMRPQARRHLKVKLAAYWVRVKVEPDDLDVKERRRSGFADRSAEPLRRPRLRGARAFGYEAVPGSKSTLTIRQPHCSPGVLSPDRSAPFRSAGIRLVGALGRVLTRDGA